MFVKKKKNNYMVNVDKYRVLFGIPSMLPAMQPKNYILILTRHFIYTCRVNSSNLNHLSWTNYVNKFLETEKLISIKNSTYDKMKTHSPGKNGLTFSGLSMLVSSSPLKFIVNRYWQFICMLYFCRITCGFILAVQITTRCRVVNVELGSALLAC